MRAFGAGCDGVHADDAAFAFAMDAANAHGGTVVVPAGMTCVLTRTFNLGYACPVGARSRDTLTCPNPTPAVGVTFRGAGLASRGNLDTQEPPNNHGLDPQSYPSTVLFDASPPDCDARVGGGFTTGSAETGTARYITFEDLAIVAGPSFRSCLINETTAGTGDPVNIVVRRVRLRGNRVGTTTSGVYLSNASWSVIDESYFSNFDHAISSCASQVTPCNNYVNDLVVTNSLFYSRSTYVHKTGWEWGKVDCNFIVNLSSAVFVRGLRMTGNAFESGPNAIHVHGVQGGDISSNWFEGEARASPHAVSAATCPANPDPVWIHVNWGMGVTIGGNYIANGYDGIWSQAYAEVIEGNHFEDTFGTNVVLRTGAAVVEGNHFQGAHGVDQVDIDVLDGSHRIGPNDHANLGAKWYVNLRVGTSGQLTAPAALSPKINDGSGGGWMRFAGGEAAFNGVLSLGHPVPTPPNPPAGGYSVYVDSADGLLKAKGANGTVTVIGRP